MRTRPNAWRVLVTGSLCALLEAQQSQPASASLPERILFPKFEYSVVPPAGWRVTKKADEKGDADDYLLTCSGDAQGGMGISLRILKYSRSSSLDAAWLADSHARAHKPKLKTLEAKDVQFGGDQAVLFVNEDQKDVFGKSVAVWTLVCIVKGEDTSIEYHVDGAKEDVLRHRPALEQCFASTRLGAWSVPGTKIKHPWHPLTLLPPEGWRVTLGSTGSSWSLGPVGDDKLRPSLTITTMDGQKDFGVSRLKALVETAQKKLYRDFRIVKEKETSVAGRKAALFHGKFKVDDKPMAQICWVAVGAPRGYVFTLNCREPELAAVQPSIEACIASVEIAKEK